MGLGLGCDNWNFLFVAVEGGGVLALGWQRGGGVEIFVTNYLARLTSSLRAKFEVEKMSDFFCLLSGQR